MSKIIWASVGLVASLATVATGAKIYADKNLAAYYQQQPIQRSNYSLKYSNYAMGAVSGSADVQFTWQQDPCLASSKMSFVGTDQIKRSWKGYEIDSTLSLQDNAEGYAKYFKQPIHAKTIIDWSGTVTTKIDLPQLEVKEKQQDFRIDPIQVKFDTQVKDLNAQIKSLELNIPQLIMNDKKGQVQLRNFSFKTNQGLNQEPLEAGFSEVSIAQVNVMLSGINTTATSFNQMNVRTDTVLKNNTVDFNAVVKLDQAQVKSGTPYRDFQMNFNLKDLNRSQVQTLFNLLQQQESSCAAAKTYEEDFSKTAFALFNAGFTVESLKNTMKSPSGMLTANMSAKIMPNYVNSPEALEKMFSSLVDAKVDLEFDKQFLVDVLSLKRDQNPALNVQQVDTMLNDLEQQGHLKQNGSMVKLAMEYKFGQPHFLTPE